MIKKINIFFISLFLVGIFSQEVQLLISILFILFSLIKHSKKEMLYSMIILAFFQNLRIGIFFIYEIYLFFVSAKSIVFFLKTKKIIFLNILILPVLFSLLNVIANIYNPVGLSNWRMLLSLITAIVTGVLFYDKNLDKEEVKNYLYGGLIFQFTIVFLENMITATTATIGTLVEPNITAAYFAAMAIFIFPYLFSNNTNTSIHTREYIYFFMAIIGNLLSTTRTTWIAFAIGIFIFFVFKNKKNKVIIQYKKIFVMFFSIITLFGTGMYFYQTNELFSYKIENLFNLETGTGGFRQNMNEQALDTFKESPISIRGTSSFGLSFNYDPKTSGLENTPAYLPNVFISTLYDTGIVGFMLLFSFFAICLFRMQVYYKKNKSEYYLSSLLAVIVMLISSYSTNSLWFPQIWIFLFIGLKVRK